MNCVGGHWRGLPAAIAACVDHTRLVGRGLNLFHVPLPHDAGHEVGIHGLDAAGIHVSNLEEGVAVAPGTALTVDDLTDPPAPIMGLHQDRIANLDLEEEGISYRLLASTGVLVECRRFGQRCPPWLSQSQR